MDKKLIKIKDQIFLAFLREQKVNTAICNEQGDYDLSGSYIDANADIVLKRTFLTVLYPSNTEGANKISSLEGIEAFSNLIALTCTGFDLEELPPLPSTLKTLNASNNKLKSLPELPPLLNYLDISGNKGIQLTSLGTVKKFFCQNCSLESLPSFPATIQYIECQDNKLKQLPDLPEGTLTVNCKNNNISTLGTLPDSLEHLDCSYNELTVKPKCNAYIKFKGNNVLKKKKEIKSYFSGKKTDNFRLKLVVVNELIKTDDVLLDEINAIVAESNVSIEMMMHGFLYEVKRYIKKLVLSQEQLDSITSLTFSRNNEILYLLDPEMEDDVDDYDLKKFDGISELKNLEMVFLESGLRKSIKLKPLLELKNVKKIDGDYFNKAFYYFKKDNVLNSVNTFDDACASFGDLSDELLERSALDPWQVGGNGTYRIVYTSDSTIVISDGVRSKLDMEFYVEIDGVIPFDDLKNHFLISFLENSINVVVKEESFKKEFYTDGLRSYALMIEGEETDIILKEHKTNAIASYYPKGYFIEPEEDLSPEEIEEYEDEYGDYEDTSKYIYTVLGIDSGNVPQFVSVKNKKIGLVSLIPYGRIWQTKSMIRRQLELTYGRCVTPFNNYSDFGKNLPVTENTESELDNCYNGEKWDTLLYLSSSLIAFGAVSYDLFYYKAKATEMIDQFTVEESVEAYKVCLDKFTGDLYPELYLTIGHLYAENRNYEESINYYNLYLNTTASLRAKKLAYIHRGKSYASLKNYETAIDDLTITYDFNRNYEGVNFLIPEYHLCNNQIKKAYDFLKHDLDMQRDDDVLIGLNILFILTSYLKKNEREESRAFTRLKKLLEPSTIIYFDLPSLLDRINQGDEFNSYILNKFVNFSFKVKEEEEEGEEESEEKED